MCGILFYKGRRYNKKQFDRALCLMSHRGPDYSETRIFNDIFMGHNRLSIIDLNKESNQPFTIENYTIIFNGEIYNYIELKKQYNLVTRTNSDTEILLQLYIKFGKECLKLLNGMFSFIVYDNLNNQIFVARDRLGIKPLYYSLINDEIFYSSEISPLLNFVSNEFDEFGLRQYRKLRMTIKGYTIYKNIKQFPPGHYSINGKLYKYWDLDPNNENNPDDEELGFLINDSVMLRKRSDVPVGSYLSGGLDSTILTFLLKPTHTWTVGFSSLNEFDWSDLADKELKSHHHKILVSKNEFLKTGNDMILKRKEPLSVPNEILIYLMTKKVKEKNTVVLSGEGADELFWGYDRIFRWAKDEKFLDINGFDKKYSYGSHVDNEVLDYALENNPGKTVLKKVAYFFQIHHLHGLLRRLDNSTMLCSVEARVPFVDHRLIELLVSGTFEWKMGNSFKEPLKRIYKNIVPTKIIDRKKIGFPVPLEELFINKKNNSYMDSWLEYNLDILKNK